jgi:hypothetical protein
MKRSAYYDRTKNYVLIRQVNKYEKLSPIQPTQGTKGKSQYRVQKEKFEEFIYIKQRER